LAFCSAVFQSATSKLNQWAYQCGNHVFSLPSQTAKVAEKQPNTTLQNPDWLSVGSSKPIIQVVHLNVIMVIASIISRGIIRQASIRSIAKVIRSLPLYPEVFLGRLGFLCRVSMDIEKSGRIRGNWSLRSACKTSDLALGKYTAKSRLS
jgi:hypothetical protein